MRNWRGKAPGERGADMPALGVGKGRRKAMRKEPGTGEEKAAERAESLIPDSQCQHFVQPAWDCSSSSGVLMTRMSAPTPASFSTRVS